MTSTSCETAATTSAGSPTASSDDYAPAWSPDGRTIAYTSAAAIRLVGVDGSRDRAFAAGQHPDWSVNRNRLAFEHAGDIWFKTSMEVAAPT